MGYNSAPNNRQLEAVGEKHHVLPCFIRWEASELVIGTVQAEAVKRRENGEQNCTCGFLSLVTRYDLVRAGGHDSKVSMVPLPLPRRVVSVSKIGNTTAATCVGRESLQFVPRC